MQYLNSAFPQAGSNYSNSGLIVVGNGGVGGLVLRTDAAAPIVFVTNGVNGEKMRITSTGNVGIGTTSPGFGLTVSNPSASNTGTMYVNATLNSSG
jgi:hypothetical protein